MYEIDREGPIEFIQVTDTHLVEAEDGHLLGLETLYSLECVLNSVKTENKRFDFFLVSGDLSQDGSQRSYQRLEDALSPFQTPSFWLPGNHDSLANMKKVAENTEHLDAVVRAPHWQLVLLNSQVEGSVHGRLADDQFELLEAALAERPDLHTLISLHHHPIPTNSRWIDNIGVKNGERLMDLVERYASIKGY